MNELDLENIIALRKTLAEILKHLLHSNAESALNDSLLLTMDFFNADRAYIGIVNNTEKSVSFTHKISSPDTKNLPANLLDYVTTSEMPWWINTILSGRDIIISDIKKMPVSASAEQKLIIENGAKSLLVVPTIIDSNVNGFIGIECINRPYVWEMIDIENLHIISNIFSIAIERELAVKNAESSFSQSLQNQTKFQLIFEKLPWGVEVYDKNGDMIAMNPADQAIFGTTMEEMSKFNMFDIPFISDENKAKLKNGEEVEMWSGHDFEMMKEKGLYASKHLGTYKYIHSKGLPLKDPDNTIFGYLLLIHDDTEIYQKNEQMQNDITKLKMVIDTGKSFIWEYDIENDRIIIDRRLINEQSSKDNKAFLFLCQASNSNKAGFGETLHPDDYERVYDQHFIPLINGEINSYSCIFRRMFEGRVYWFNAYARVIKYNEEGKPSRTVCYVTDITEERERELELIHVKEADQLKTTFLANMSHEIRTPLNAIVGFSQIITEMNEDKEMQPYIDIIQKNNDLLLQLIDDILNFTKLESGILDYQLAKIEAKDVCQDLIYRYAQLMTPETKLIFDNNLSDIPIWTDEKLIKQVISSFINNAIKFTQKGSIALSYNTTKKDNHLCFLVTDTGIGISDKDLPFVFDRFFKADSFQQGTGLGLTVCKMIINLLGGEIGVESTIGQGSTFWFTLPLENRSV